MCKRFHPRKSLSLKSRGKLILLEFDQSCLNLTNDPLLFAFTCVIGSGISFLNFLFGSLITPSTTLLSHVIFIDHPHSILLCTAFCLLSYLLATHGSNLSILKPQYINALDSSLQNSSASCSVLFFQLCIQHLVVLIFT